MSKKKSPFASAADTFEKWGNDYLSVAANTTYIASRAAILREASHYFACAARLRGQPVAPVKTEGWKYRSARR